MKLTVKGIEEGQPVPEKFALGIYDPENHMALGQNLNPQLQWSDVPEGTRSLVVMIKDRDAPSVADDVNQEGKTVSSDIPRVDFYHWLLVDVPPTVNKIDEGQESHEVVPGGKKPVTDALGKRGINDYTDFLAGNPDMAGTYGGYDGPCPPWNDEIVHRYVFTVFALDTDSLGLGEAFRGGDVEQAIDGHVLDQSSVMGTYTLNPELS